MYWEKTTLHSGLGQRDPNFHRVFPFQSMFDGLIDSGARSVARCVESVSTKFLDPPMCANLLHFPPFKILDLI